MSYSASALSPSDGGDNAEIEHDILRKRFEEPRIHSAIVCASFSCPDLASEAYVADRVDAQLGRATRRSLAKDFERDGSVLDFIGPYISAQERTFVAEHGDRLKVRHLDYDWKLNGS